ncbi:TOMM precursor leader peptide-binding protein [Rudaeicoccus suwonensis]|uniref:Ribosomal protein S12 methylthiotransferase accessory factor n=1 Tax=Rudaeicoccus suwonensis TaxID=657409 RepID=A0A561ECR9_9MICO|nr:TOMM precursor leader peptide-binding protein [Rudaeicoccus suwonensis]TWE13402.1 ribosomal protein S12 methylthiotransferase accessory factor [Rudaeicoccus suwonensis]
MTGVGLSRPKSRTVGEGHSGSLPNRPRLRADLDVICDGDSRHIFAADDRLFYLEDAHLALVLPLLDGTRATPQIHRELGGTLGFVQLFGLLSRLHALDALRDGPVDAGDRAGWAIRDALGIPAVARRPLDVLPIGLGDRLRDLVVTAVAGTRPDAEVHDQLPAVLDADRDLLVVVSDVLTPELEQVNRACLAAGVTWILLKPTTTQVWVGPLVVPGSSACWRCLAHRVAGHRTLDRYVAMVTDRNDPVGVQEAGTASTVGSALHLALTMLDKNESDLVVSLNLATFETERHILSRRPECPSCGHGVRIESDTLVSRPKRRNKQGEIERRIRDSEELLADLEPHISPITGVVTVLSSVDTQSELFYGYAAGHDFAISRTRFDVLARTLRGSLSGGKGRTESSARLSAICEAVERGVTVHRGDEQEFVAALSQLEPGRALDVDTLFGFSEMQYRGREDFNAGTQSRYEFVPTRFDPQRPISWTTVHGLGSTAGEQRLIPSAYCYYGHPDMYRWWFCVADSNGTAAGGCLEEAVVRGFCELVERDSVALWWYNRIQRPAVDLDVLEDPYLDATREAYARLGRDIWAIDLTTDSRIPCYAVLSAKSDADPQDIIVGFGSDLDPMAAFGSAVDELNQFLPTVLPDPSRGPGEYWSADQEAVRWYRTATLQNQPYLLPGPQPRTDLRTVQSWVTDDVLADVEACCSAAERMGTQLYFKDLSRPEVPLSVARVVAPGLRHFWRRLGPGRLYDAPVRLGWLPEPLPEADLNPTTVFF